MDEVKINLNDKVVLESRYEELLGKIRRKQGGILPYLELPWLVQQIDLNDEKSKNDLKK